MSSLTELPKATGIDLQYRLMLFKLAREATRQLNTLRFWKYKRRKLLETMIYNIYKALA